MKLILLIFLMFAVSESKATIAGPSCDELTRTQTRLLMNAAKSYIRNKNSVGSEVTILPKSLKASSADCHDYDGVHSSSVFLVVWSQVAVDQEMECSQEIGVTADYDVKKKLLVIDKNTKLVAEEVTDVECTN